MTVETASHSCIGLKQVLIWTNWKFFGPAAIWTIQFFIFSVKYTDICQRFSLFLHICSSHGKRLILLLSWHRTIYHIYYTIYIIFTEFFKLNVWNYNVTHLYEVDYRLLSHISSYLYEIFQLVIWTILIFLNLLLFKLLHSLF